MSKFFETPVKPALEIQNLSQLPISRRLAVSWLYHSLPCYSILHLFHAHAWIRRKHGRSNLFGSRGLTAAPTSHNKSDYFPGMTFRFKHKPRKVGKPPHRILALFYWSFHITIDRSCIQVSNSLHIQKRASIAQTSPQSGREEKQYLFVSYSEVPCGKREYHNNEQRLGAHSPRRCLTRCVGENYETDNHSVIKTAFDVKLMYVPPLYTPPCCTSALCIKMPQMFMKASNLEHSYRGQDHQREHDYE